MKRSVILTVMAVLLLGCSACQQEEHDIRTKIKKAELGTVEYTVRQIIRNSDESWQFFGDRKVLFSVKATLKAGIDLDKLAEEDIEVTGDRIQVRLPMPEILSLNIRPDDIKLEYSKVSSLRSDYTQQEYDQILAAGEQEIRNDNALKNSILNDAKASAEEFFEILLHGSGFSEVEILFKEA